MDPIATGIPAFESAFQALCGTKCWGIVAGQGTGSRIALDFGNKQPRKKPIENSFLTPDQRKYRGEFSLFVTCAWRLETKTNIVCGSEDNNANNGPMCAGLKHVAGATVVAETLLIPSLDAVIAFSNGYTLRIFCLHTNTQEEEENYSLFTPRGIYKVGCRSSLSIESKKELALRDR